jgi:redox-sensitive bicupin YhaK (pirin superfamily)
MIDHRPASTHGLTEFSGLHSVHHFCFGRYQAADRINWGSLRSLNHVSIDPKGACDPHFLGNMEVILLMEAGRLVVHVDDLEIPIETDDILSISTGAGTDYGVSNRSVDAAQYTEIWLALTDPLAARSIRRGRLDRDHDAIIASAQRSDSAHISTQTAAKLTLLVLEGGEDRTVALQANGYAYLYVAEGDLTISGFSCVGGDAVAVDKEAAIRIQARHPSRCLLIETP